jgi:hypothetical protein
VINQQLVRNWAILNYEKKSNKIVEIYTAVRPKIKINEKYIIQSYIINNNNISKVNRGFSRTYVPRGRRIILFRVWLKEGNSHTLQQLANPIETR